jgi:hypothetical protein
MPSKRKKNTKPLADRLAELAPSGASGPAVHGLLRGEGYSISLRSVGRTLRRLRGTQRVARRVTGPPEATQASTPVQMPSAEEIAEIESATLETLDSWLELAGRQARAAEARGDAASVARFGSLAATIFEARRKAKPKEEQPAGVFVTMESMRDDGQKARDRILNIANRIAALSDSWPTCPTCGHRIAPADLEDQIELMGPQ